MQKVEAYRASDGALFPTPNQCQVHEVSLLWRARIEEFMASKFCPYNAGSPMKISFNIIVAWEQFKESHRGAEPETVDVDKVADMGPVIDLPVRRKPARAKKKT